jgi:CHAT domain-containing protein
MFGARLDVEFPADLVLHPGRWSTRVLASLAGVAALLLVPSGPKARREWVGSAAYTRELAELAATLEGSRAIEPRLTGGFRYAPYSEAPLASSARIGKIKLDIARKAAREAARRSARRSAEDLGAMASVHLLAREADGAIQALREAIDEGAEDPRLFSDLAAAYLVRAKEAGTPYDFILGLKAADRALALEPALPEARFNRALALTRLSLIPEADKAWSHYLALGEDSGWSVEARNHLDVLALPREAKLWEEDQKRLDQAALAGDEAEVRRIVGAYRQAARLYVEDFLLGRWAQEREAGQAEESGRFLARARVIAAALEGAEMLRKAVRAIEEANGDRLESLQRGHAFYIQARKHHEEQEYEAAEALFTAAAQALEAGGSPFAAWPAYFHAVIAHHHGDNARALQELAALRERVEGEGYAPLLGSIDWIMGLAQGRLGPIANARDACESARALFEAAGEVENRAAMDDLLSRIYDGLEDFDRAWRHRYAALEVLPRLHKARRIENILSGAVLGLQKKGDLQEALYFQSMLLAEAESHGSPLPITIARRVLASLLHELKQTAEAVLELDGARQEAVGIPDSALRQSVEMDTWLAQGRILRESDPEASLRALDAARGVSLEKKNLHLLIEILRERAETCLVLGREAEAQEDSAAALAELERQRRVLQDDKLRVFFADQGRALLELQIDLQRRLRERDDLILDTAERMRGRGLVEASGGAGGAGAEPPRPSREIAAALPPGTALVEYLWVRGRLLAWVIRQEGVYLVDFAGLERDGLDSLVERFGKGLAEGRLAETRSAGRELHQAVVAPLASWLVGASTLVIVPDGSLHGVSFSALVAGDGRFLLEKYLLGVAPGADAYLSFAELYQARSGSAPASALVVGDADFDSAFYALPALPGSSREIQEVAQGYGRAVLLTDERATQEALLAALPDHDVLHTSGHTATLPGSETPGLLLTPSAGATDGGLLTPDEIRLSRPPRTRLALLAGCGTATGRLSASEGTLGLSRAFLAAGVPLVIASLWDVDDESVSRLLPRFHAYLRGGADPLTSLRRAQLDLLRSPDSTLASPSTWAAFQALGGAFTAGADLSPPVPF